MFSRLILFMVVITTCCMPVRGQSWPDTPRRMHDVHLDQFAIWLDLSPEQENAIRLMCEDYREAWSALLPEVTSEFHRTFEVFQKESDKPEEWQHRQLELMTQLHRDAELIRIARKRHDEAFFDGIERLLTEEQARAMPRVRRWRERTNLTSSGIHNSFPPEAGQIDLLTLIREETDRPRRRFSAGEPEYITLSPHEFAAAYPAMEEYELQFIATLRHAVAADRRLAGENYRRLDISTSLQSIGATADTHPDEFAEMEELKREVGKARIALAGEVIRVNRLGLMLICNALPADKAAELTRMYNEIAYSRVYPDPMSAEPLYEHVLELETLDDVQAGSIRALQEMYQQRHATLSKQMAATRDVFYEIRYTREDGWFEDQEHNEMGCNVLGLAREQLNDRQRELVTLMLLPEQVAVLPGPGELYQPLDDPPPGVNDRLRPWFEKRAGFPPRHQRDAFVELYTAAERRQMREATRRLLSSPTFPDQYRSHHERLLEILESIPDKALPPIDD